MKDVFETCEMTKGLTTIKFRVKLKPEYVGKFDEEEIARRIDHANFGYIIDFYDGETCIGEVYTD